MKHVAEIGAEFFESVTELALGQLIKTRPDLTQFAA